MRLKMLRRLRMLAVIPVCEAVSLMAQSADTDSRIEPAIFMLPLDSRSRSTGLISRSPSYWATQGVKYATGVGFGMDIAGIAFKTTKFQSDPTASGVP